MTQENYEEIVNGSHKGHLSHDVIAAAAAWQATKAWSEHQAKNGKEPSHQKTKEFLAATSAAVITRIFETKGLDLIDSHKVKAAAKELHDKQLNNGGY